MPLQRGRARHEACRAALTLGATLACITTAGAARAADEPVALVSVKLGAALSSARDRIVSEAERGLTAAGVALLPVKDTLAAPGSDAERCRDTGCTRALATTLSASHVIRAEVTSSTEAFSIHMTFVRARDGAVLADETLTCASTDPCQPVPESMNEVAREVGRKARHELALQTPPEPPTVTTPPPVSEPAPPPVDVAPRPETPHWSKSPWPWLAGGAVAAGALFTGLYYLSIDGDGTDCQPSGACLGLRDTAGPGVFWTVAGGVLAAGATIGYFVVGPGAHQTSERAHANRTTIGVQVLPGALSLSGRF